MESLYILECENGKWYVGKSTDVQRRFKQHAEGKGSEWTRKYAPIRIAETHRVTSEFDETNITKGLMKKYGIDNVRGGAYATVDLPEEIETLIRHEFRAASDACYKCGKKGHFANKCKGRSSFTGTCGCGQSFLDFEEFMSHHRGCLSKQVAARKQPTKPSSQKGTCHRCGRSGHWASKCYARTDTDGNNLSDVEFESESEEDENACHRCGRSGHWASKCYARRHIDGSEID